MASVCGFGSLRASSEGSRGGGLRRIFELHQLQPRLGFFVDKPAALPYDYDDVLSLILAQPSAGGKQRKVFVLSPQDDRVHNVTEVERLILRLTPLARQGLTLSTPAGINRLDDGKQHAVVDWLHATVASADIKPVAVKLMVFQGARRTRQTGANGFVYGPTEADGLGVLLLLLDRVVPVTPEEQGKLLVALRENRAGMVAALALPRSEWDFRAWTVSDRPFNVLGVHADVFGSPASRVLYPLDLTGDAARPWKAKLDQMLAAVAKHGAALRKTTFFDELEGELAVLSRIDAISSEQSDAATKSRKNYMLNSMVRYRTPVMRYAANMASTTKLRSLGALKLGHLEYMKALQQLLLPDSQAVFACWEQLWEASMEHPEFFP